MAASENKTEVLISGAGPSGLMMACQLSLFNIRFRIIDKKQSPSNHSGALIIHARTLELFQQLGLADKILHAGTKINALSVFFEGKKPLRLDLKNFGTDVSQFPSMLMLKQSVTEKLLIDFLKQAGHFVERNTELTDIEHHNEIVKTSIKKPNGTEEKIESRYLIAADGGQSKVRSFLKIPFIGKTNKMDLCILECKADVDLPLSEIGFSFSGKVTAGFFPLSGDNWRIDVAPVKVSEKNKNLLNFEVIQQILDTQTNLHANIKDPEFFSVFHSHKRYAATFRNNSCFLVGDAAHLYSPVGAQGMNSGLQDAQNLAWKMGMVINGLAKTDILTTYEQERKPLARKASRTINWFFNFVASKIYFYRVVRLTVLPNFLNFFFRIMKWKQASIFVFNRISGTGIRYKPNALVKTNRISQMLGNPNPGERLPLLSYSTNGRKKNIRENIKCTTFHLLLFFKEKNAAKKIEAIARKYKKALTTEFVPFGPGTESLYKKLRFKSGGWYLVRPDFYIAARSAKMNVKKLDKFLSQLLIPGNNEKI